MSRILIIGSEGQLGSELSRFFNKKMIKDDIIISDIREVSSLDLNYIKLDALSYTDLKKAVNDYDINEI